MKNLKNFVAEGKYTSIKEGRRPKDKYDVDDIEGKSAEKNGTKGLIGIGEPEDDRAIRIAKKLKTLNREEFDKNKNALYRKFVKRDDFFIIGRAGWGKTSIIKDMAEKAGINPETNIITMYLDKAEATDLGGIPIAGKDENGKPAQIILPPPFAQDIAARPDEDFLLFFDEMNQAQPDVMNALMPIVLEHEIANKHYDNFFVGAAGNFADENDAVSSLSRPLRSRFRPIITWETHTKAAWTSAFKYLHSKWDERISKTLVDKFEENADVFDNPREVEQKIFDRGIWTCIKAETNFSAKEWLEDFKGLLVGDSDNDEKNYEALTKTQRDNVVKLAELTYKTVENGGKDTEGVKTRKRGGNTIDKEFKDMVTSAIKNGFIPTTVPGDIDSKTPGAEEGKDYFNIKYGISKENYGILKDALDTGAGLNREEFERFIKSLIADGIKFKYEKDSEWKNLPNFYDPMDEDEDIIRAEKKRWAEKHK